MQVISHKCTLPFRSTVTRPRFCKSPNAFPNGPCPTPRPSHISLLSLFRLSLPPLRPIQSTIAFSIFSTSSLDPPSCFSASSVLDEKRRTASSTSPSVTTGERRSLASDSEMRVMASSCRTVMGMGERVEEEDSAREICRRMVTKCEDSFSAAWGERRGAHRLVDRQHDSWAGGGKLRSRPAVADVPLHRLHRDLAFHDLLAAALVQAHDVLGDAHVSFGVVRVLDDVDHVEA